MRRRPLLQLLAPVVPERARRLPAQCLELLQLSRRVLSLLRREEVGYLGEHARFKLAQPVVEAADVTVKLLVGPVELLELGHKHARRHQPVGDGLLLVVLLKAQHGVEALGADARLATPRLVVQKRHASLLEIVVESRQVWRGRGRSAR
eukprot:960724-Pleurochrysis_carterae.AAC.1